VKLRKCVLPVSTVDNSGGKRSGRLVGIPLNKPDFSRAAMEEGFSTNFRSRQRDSRSTTEMTPSSSAQHTPTERRGQIISPNPGEQPILVQSAPDATRLVERLLIRAPATSHHPHDSQQITFEPELRRGACINQVCAFHSPLNFFWPSSQERFQQKCLKS
jgi:hypothetical protein